MKRKGFKRAHRDDVERAWGGANAGLGVSGGNGLVLAVLLGLVAWKVMVP